MAEMGILAFQISEIAAAVCMVTVITITLVTAALIARYLIKRTTNEQE